AIFRQAGLTDEEGAVYAALAEVGAMSVASIARRAGLHRPVVYQALASLQKCELVTTQTQGKRAHYVAASPAKLRALAAERTATFEQTLVLLERAYANRGERPAIRTLEGAQALQRVLDDLAEQLPKGGTFYRYSSRKPSLDAERFVPKNFRQRRDAKRLEQFVITNAALRASPHQQRIACFSKVVPKVEDPFEYNVALLIYGNRVVTVDYESETAVIIDNERVARFHERIFRLLFGRL
ncbi:MAG: helix-turn-helix domain-containing protein, partial [bacterium]|nr:helix-turn-helix domain-containing protein [bacterium]